MTTVARRDPADKAKIDAIEKKLLANPDIAKLIDDLGTEGVRKFVCEALIQKEFHR
ncbi:hypothetical protein [Corynebacterium striatum]|uniref:hypothetical protein n=1 Tax=Corynebacterium striatum TaxID=43770 RepID=UPI001FC8A15C|nr:hypothetical protein [Corynebacterium striatum]GKH16234.1 hypothetical protein CE91St29_05470 [Corynebacterium striatum]